MNPNPTQVACVDCAVAVRPLGDEAVFGDRHVVRCFKDGALLAVIDGVGHGHEARTAALAAAAVLKTHAEETLISLIKRCHEALVRTRGVAMTMVAIRTANNSAAWLGVGNVEGRLYRVDPRNKPRSEGAILRGGIVGYHLPLLRPDAVEIEPGDCFVLATDGVRADFSATVDAKRSPQENADGVLSQHFKGTDDALVLVARYIGEGHD